MSSDILGDIKSPRYVHAVSEEIRKLKIEKRISIMHVCGTHEHTISKSGLRSLLPENVRLIAGPGCPVCVCSSAEIDLAIRLATEHGVILTTFGDMYRVPATGGSMEYFKAMGADIRVVYSPMDAVALARGNPTREVVFMAVGFETTAAPISAAVLSGPPENFSLVTSLKVIPPALRFLLDRGATEIDGFILPGHVSAIIGRKVYDFLAEEYKVPGAIAGFEAVDVLLAVKNIVEQVVSNTQPVVSNLYTRVVKENGNEKAIASIGRVFRTGDANWRGIGIIPDTGLYLAEEFEHLDARKKFGVAPEKAVEIQPGCLCDKVILGEAEPEDCALFATTCTPSKPYGPCMVSSEGTCRARYNYRRVD